MGKSKKALIAVFLSLTLMFPKPCRADLFGGDVVVLTQILSRKRDTAAHSVEATSEHWFGYSWTPARY